MFRIELFNSKYFIICFGCQMWVVNLTFNCLHYFRFRIKIKFLHFDHNLHFRGCSNHAVTASFVGQAAAPRNIRKERTGWVRNSVYSEEILIWEYNPETSFAVYMWLNTYQFLPTKLSADEEQEKEEIIAEDYDDAEEPSQYDYDEPVRKRRDNPWTENIKKRLTAGQIAGYKSCPNKYNIYHKCTLFCVTFWNGKEKMPTEEYFLRKKRLLKRYPLPKNWVEVFDSGWWVFLPF